MHTHPLSREGLHTSLETSLYMSIHAWPSLLFTPPNTQGKTLELWFRNQYQTSTCLSVFQVIREFLRPPDSLDVNRAQVSTWTQPQLHSALVRILHVCPCFFLGGGGAGDIYPFKKFCRPIMQPVKRPSSYIAKPVSCYPQPKILLHVCAIPPPTPPPPVKFSEINLELCHLFLLWRSH